MKTFIKIFALLIIFSGTNVEAAELNFQELRSRIILPVLPDRIRHRKDSPRLQRPAPRQIEAPKKTQPNKIYPQRQPKKPSHVRTPKLPQKNWAQRGSNPRKRFNPPRF